MCKVKPVDFVWEEGRPPPTPEEMKKAFKPLSEVRKRRNWDKFNKQGDVVMKTSEEWQKESSVTVLDPDGWDRQNFQFSWYEEMITKEQFEERVKWSTCIYTNKGD